MTKEPRVIVDWFESGDRCVWYLARRPLKVRIVSGEPIIDPITGNRAGIQHGPKDEVEELWPSSKCPLCLLDDPHAHGIEELNRLRQMVAYLEQKLGVSK